MYANSDGERLQNVCGSVMFCPIHFGIYHIVLVDTV